MSGSIAALGASYHSSKGTSARDRGEEAGLQLGGGKVHAAEGCLCEFILQHEAESCSECLLPSCFSPHSSVCPKQLCPLPFGGVHCCGQGCMCAQHVAVEVRGQPWTLLFRHLPISETRSLNGQKSCHMGQVRHGAWLFCGTQIQTRVSGS